MNFQRMLALQSEASQMCAVLDLHAYVTVSTIGEKAGDQSLQRAVTVGEWANGPDSLDPDSRCAHVAHCKAGELVLMNGGLGSRGQLITTPFDTKYSLHYQGGAALGGMAVAVSGWAQEHDLLFALALLWSYRDDSFQMHHGGKCFATRAEFEAANSARTDGMYRPVKGDGAHERMYFKLGNGSYLEHQLFPDGRPASMHWDIYCSHPDAFLSFVAGVFGKKPELWDNPGKGPIGMFSITAGENTMAVMARKEWWVVEEG